MTNEEALLILKNMVCTEGWLSEARDIACGALKKQIPKKPIKKENSYYYCPNCDANEWSITYDMIDKYDYCIECGQKLEKEIK